MTTTIEAGETRPAFYQDPEWMKEHYVDKQWSTTDIAEYCGISFKTVSRWLAKFNITTRDARTAQLTPSKVRKRAASQGLVRDYIAQQRLATKEAEGWNLTPQRGGAL